MNEPALEITPFLENSDRLQILEAMIFASGEPIAHDILAAALDISHDELLLVVEELKTEISERKTSIQLISVGGKLQFRTAPEFAVYLQRLKEEKPRKLSNASLETLAIVAYRQPVTKHDIDTIRGVDVGPTITTLLDRELVTIVGHKATVGHPALYGTTDKFLEIFGLNSLGDLPNLRDVSDLTNEIEEVNQLDLPEPQPAELQS